MLYSAGAPLALAAMAFTVRLWLLRLARVGAAGALCSALLMLKATGALAAWVWVAVSAAVAVTV